MEAAQLGMSLQAAYVALCLRCPVPTLPCAYVALCLRCPVPTSPCRRSWAAAHHPLPHFHYQLRVRPRFLPGPLPGGPHCLPN